MTDLRTPLLSICVPTYNRAAYLPNLFESIEREIASLPEAWSRDDVEVVLCDNASPDDTPAVAAAFASRLRLTYHRHPENLGADRNFLAVVEKASGVFCWLMGDDDAIGQGGLLRVLEAARNWSGAAGFSVNYAVYDSDLRRKLERRDPVALDRDTLVTGAEAIYTTFIGHWGLMCSHVVRRDVWNQVCATGDQLGFLNAYVHVYVMARMAQDVPRWGYVAQSCAMWRSGNDSFLLGRTWLGRMKLDVFAYHQFAVALFGEGSSTERMARNEIAGTHILDQFRSAKARGRPALAEAAALITRYYWKSPTYWTRILPWILVPSPIVRPLFRVYLRRREARLAAMRE